jgi:hypothetical protein
MVFCQEFCESWLERICHESLKLQLLFEIDSLRKRAYLLPRENLVFSMNKAMSGEHSYAAYNEDTKDAKSQEPFFNN